MAEIFDVGLCTIVQGDNLETLRCMPDESVQCVVTSPPYYGLRDYGMDGQMGLEKTPQEYVDRMVVLFREVRRVLRNDGTLWLNLGDSYAAKDLIGIPWRVAFALQADDWYLRQDIIWHKPNPMPESTTDRCTKAHEYVFMLSKLPKYYYNADAIKTPPSEALLKQVAEGYNGTSTKDFVTSGAQDASSTKSRIIEGARKKIDKQRGHGRRHAGFNSRWDAMTREEQMLLGANKRDVWTVAAKPFKEAHFATFPPELIEPCILAGSKPGDIVLDPFGGAATVGVVAGRHKRKSFLLELNPEYVALSVRRLTHDIDKEAA